MEKPLTGNAIHLCLDMQNIFAPGGLWATPWMPKVVPVVHELSKRFGERTVFTRFMTPFSADDMPGKWRDYYEKWQAATRTRLDPRQLELVPELARLVPPATVISKGRYSAFAGTRLLEYLQKRKADALVITGAETDVCVASTVLSAVDFEFRTIVVTDAICSSSDDGHDASLKVYRTRFSEQIETAGAQEVLRALADKDNP